MRQLILQHDEFYMWSKQCPAYVMAVLNGDSYVHAACHIAQLRCIAHILCLSWLFIN